MDDTIKLSGSTLITNGILSLIAGIFLLFLTGISQTLVVIIFAAYAIIFGISQVIAAKGERDPQSNAGTLRAIGIFSILAGILLLFFTNAALPIVIFLIAAHAVITGLSELMAAYAYRDEVKGNAWWVGAALIRVAFGLYLVFNLGMPLRELILAIAWYAIIIGPVLAVFGYETRTKEVGYRRHLAH